MNSVEAPQAFLIMHHIGWRIRAVRLASIAWIALLLAGFMTFPLMVRGAQLIVADGVIVKFGPDAGLVVRDALRTGRSVVFTSLEDDTLGGQSQPQRGAPFPGEWAGVTLDAAAPPGQVVLDGLSLRYAGGAGGAALSFQQHDYAFTDLSVRDSLMGIRAAGGGTARLTGFLLANNKVGLQAQDGATPTLVGSDVHGNSSFGVENQHPTTRVLATGNWWGAASGPTDPIGNPAGRGDNVSAGVDYGQYRTSPPLVECHVTPKDGYQTRTTSVTLLLSCTNATDYRVSEQADLSDATFAPMTVSVPFTLSATAGEKMIYAEYRGAVNETRIVQLPQPIHYVSSGPQIRLIAPPAGAVLTADTLLQAQASDDQGLNQVEFWVDATRLATVTTPPYQTLWMLGAIANGPHTIKAVAINTRQQSATAQIAVTVQRQDNEGPTLEVSFNGAALESGAMLTAPGALTLKASDPNGVKTLVLALDGQTLATFDAGNALSITKSHRLDFATIANGAHTFTFTATDGVGNSRTQTVPFTLNLETPSVPRITTPTDGTTVRQGSVMVSGIAPVGSQVQLYVDGAVVGPLLSVSASGSFSGTVTLSTEGAHTLQADARNARGSSARSEAITIQYSASAPVVRFTSPAPGAVLTAATTLQLTAFDTSGISEVTLSLDGQPLARLTGPSFQYLWEIANVAEGSHTLQAIATASNGKTAQAELIVTVQRTPPPPPPTAYTGKVLGIEPTISYGPQPITLTGQALDRAGQPVANATLRLVLQVGGFKRAIALASDGTGAFRYTFVPQPNDAGVYQVSVIHPDETLLPDQGHFTINRVFFDIGQYSFTATRGFPTTITVNASASAGTGVQGLHWEARPADQPSGALPLGIHIDGGTGIDLAPNAHAPLTLIFRADANALQESGTLFLTALASDSGPAVRGLLRLDYRLGDARPVLFAQPTYLELGARQGEAVSGKMSIGNRGLAAATGVTVRLLADNGAAPPSWLFLASTPTVGTLDVGQNQLVQVTAAPSASVADGVYTARLRIEAANASGGDVPVSVSVTQKGEGGVRFHVADIFTETLDAQGQPIPGVTGAVLTVQNEAVTSVQSRVMTDSQGVALIDKLPPGTYRYRASAPNHVDTSGRLQIQPGVTASQAVFLDYALINVSFSVTETTIQDRYDLTLTASYLTQVPAPVVLMEPLAVNIPDLQVGESLTGELAMTNYGLVRADHLTFMPPESDEFYQYEWLGVVPTTLAAKSRVTIPYRITVRKLPSQKLMLIGQAPLMGASEDERYAQTLRQTLIRRFDVSACASYSTVASMRYDYACANGDVRSSGASTVFSRLRGRSCGASGGGTYVPPSPRCTADWCHDGGGFGGGSGGGSSPGAIPLTPSCTPDCPSNTTCCGGNGGSGPGGPPSGDGPAGDRGPWSGGPVLGSGSGGGYGAGF